MFSQILLVSCSKVVFIDHAQKQQAMSLLSGPPKLVNCKNENTYKIKTFMNILLQLKKKTIKLGFFFRVKEKILVFSYPRFSASHYSSRVSMDRENLIYFVKKRQEVLTQGGKNLLTFPTSSGVHQSTPTTYGYHHRWRLVNTISGNWQRQSLLSKKKICHYAPVRYLSTKTLASDIQILRNSKSSRELSLTDKFISFLTINGKKSKAHAIFFIALKLCYNKLVTTKYIKDISESPIKILHQAVENIKPSVEIRKVRIAASTYQVPSTTPKKRQETLAIRWIIISAQKTKKKY